MHACSAGNQELPILHFFMVSRTVSDCVASLDIIRCAQIGCRVHCTVQQALTEGLRVIDIRIINARVSSCLYVHLSSCCIRITLT